MQRARLGSPSFALRFLAATACVAACSLEGEGTGRLEGSTDDDPSDTPTGSRRDSGADAAIDARTKPMPDDPPASDAYVPVGDAATDARVATDASSDARVDTGVADAGPSCTVAGAYAALVDFNVEWIPTTLAGVLPVLKGGVGNIRMFAIATLNAAGTAVLKPCGTTVPDFEATEIVGSELYGGDIPVTAWEASTIPSFSTRWATVCDRPGCSYQGEESTFVLGARPVVAAPVWPPQGGWTMAGQYEATDDDNDGRPGLTMITRGPPMMTDAGRPYAWPPVGLAQYGRARKLHLAMSLRVKLNGALQTCDVISGVSTAAEVHVSAVGCTGVLEGGDLQEVLCDPDTARFVDQNLPMWTVKESTFKMVRLPPGGGCYTARTLLTQ